MNEQGNVFMVNACALVLVFHQINPKKCLKLMSSNTSNIRRMNILKCFLFVGVIKN